MPYVVTPQRTAVEVDIDNLILSIKTAIPVTERRKGMANFVITSLLLNILKPVEGWNYSALADVIATLECAKLEIYRRLIGLYEDKAIEKNGDLPEFGV